MKEEKVVENKKKSQFRFFYAQKIAIYVFI
jgi:hypothetical protein